MHFTDGTAEYRNILAVYIHKAAFDSSVAGNNTVVGSCFGREVEVSGACCDHAADLNEAVSVKHRINSHACCSLRITHCYSSIVCVTLYFLLNHNSKNDFYQLFN